MSWSNVKLIFFREVRDQLRDRRTLFMIAVLPMLLYPLMGMVMLKVMEFPREHTARVWLVGADYLPDDPQLLTGETFAASVFPEADAKLIRLTISREIPPEMSTDKGARQAAQRAIEDETYDAVIVFPPHFAQELKKFREQILDAPPPTGTENDPMRHAPQPEIFGNTANDKSRTALNRLDAVMLRWRQEVVKGNLAARNVPPKATAPFDVIATDIADKSTRQAALWSRILPFVVFVWALTGAFYPAIDLCAGEKERGTLETLLTSPAQRSEIVWGKLLTVMCFSIATSILNLVTFAATGGFVATQMQQHTGGGGMQLGSPPVLALLWLVVALIPLSAMFSALSIAVASFAKSSKEGQYYLMPLLLFSLPLMIIPIMPATELEMGTAIIPVTGVSFLLRELMEGQYINAARYALPVIGVTAACCLLAVRWAVDQFNCEAVLFRESERLDLRLWLRQLVRDRKETPTAGQALMCGITILVAQFFVSLAAPKIADFRSFAVTTVVMQIAVIATPAILMALFFTSNVRKTLLLKPPRWQMLPFAVALAVLLHPVALWLNSVIQQMYPMNETTLAQLKGLNDLIGGQPTIIIVLLMALTPAICEELAFRGFILSGMRHTGHQWLAIAASSFFFGVTHGMLQQSLSAFCLGLVIGYIALRSGSLLPGMLFHFTHNALVLTIPEWLPALREMVPGVDRVVALGDNEVGWHPGVALACAALAVGLLYWLHRQPYVESAEERLQEALDHQTITARPAWRFW